MACHAHHATHYLNLDRDGDVYKSNVKKFSDQETQIEKTREEIATLVNRVAELQKSLDEYIMGLDMQ